jgi:hypothetical protein
MVEGSWFVVSVGSARFGVEGGQGWTDEQMFVSCVIVDGYMWLDGWATGSGYLLSSS